MKAGWKTRIDERRYFEEKQEKKRSRLIEMRERDLHLRVAINHAKILEEFPMPEPQRMKRGFWGGWIPA